VSHPARVWWQFATVSFIWGTTWLVIKTQLGVVPPSWSVTYRFLVAAAALVIWCVVARKSLRLGPGGHAFAAVAGLFQFCLNFNFVYRAEEHVTSGLVAVGFALLMIPNALLARLTLGRRVSGRFLAGGTVGILGVALLFAREFTAPAPMTGNVPLGIALFLAAVLSASVANVMQATDRARSFDPLPALAWAMLYGVAFNIVAALVLSGPPVWDPRPIYIAGILWLGLAASSLAFALYYSMIRVMGPGEAAWSSVVTPVVAMALSTLFEGYRWSPQAVLGAVVAFVGLVIALRPPARVPRSAPDGTAAAAPTGPR
jgi:drug/metabolite transporter (DMT)-like permease